MSIFRYKANSPRGKLVEGLIEAPNEDIIIEEMKQGSFSLTYLKPLGEIESLSVFLRTVIPGFKAPVVETFKRLSDEAQEEKRQPRAPVFFESCMKIARGKGVSVDKSRLATFVRELSILLRAGVPLDRAMTLIEVSEKESRSLKEVISSIKKDLLGGFSLVQAFSKHPDVFTAGFIGILNVGEETGKMAEAIETLAMDLEREDRLQKCVKAALTYPAFVFLTALICNFGIFLYIFPQIAVVLQDMKLELPLCTRIMIFSINMLKDPYSLIIACIIAVLVIIQTMTYLRTPVGSYNLGALKLKIPVIGALNRKLFAEKFCRSMGMFFHYNVPVLSSIKIVGDMFDNPYLEDAFFGPLNQKVKTGEELDLALSESRQLPEVVTNLVAIGNQTGDLASCFWKAAEILELEINQTLQSLVVLIEPFIVSFLGFAILFAMVSMFLPLYQVVAHIGS